MRTLDEVLAAHPLPFPPPAKLEALQIEDILRLAANMRQLANLPVGYGKTVIATYATLMQDPEVVLVVVPPILQVQWLKWLRSIPGIGPSIIYEGTPAKRRAINLNAYRWLVMSYGVFRNDIDRLYAELAPKDNVVIVDEAQAMKNHNSTLYCNVRDFAEGKPLLQLSGTPTSSPKDVYSYIKLHTSGVYKTYKEFENIHVEEFDFYEQPIAWRELDLMKERYNAVQIYRTKEEVHAALPKARYIPIYYDMDKEHKALYKRLLTEQLLELDDGTKIDATTAQTLAHKAQQIITNWGYFASDPGKRSKVLDLLDTVIDEIGLGGEGASKLMLWTQYKITSRYMLDYMQQATHKLGGHAVAAYSEVNSRKSVALFMDDPLTWALVAQPQSAGAGLNPQHVCWEMAFLETPTRTGPFIQAAGRIDRKGQRFNPNIRIFVARGTVQEGLLQNLLANDDEVIEATGTKDSIRRLLFPDEN